MPTLTQITQSICKTPTINRSPKRALNRFLLHQRQLALISSDKPQELKPTKVVYIGMIKAVIAFVNGRLRIAIPSITLVCLQSSQWTLLPRKGKSGDLPPRKGFAEKWHATILLTCPI